jgi:hypothetical protein
MKNAVFVDVAPCGFIINRHFGGTSAYNKHTQRLIPEDGIVQFFFRKFFAVCPCHIYFAHFTG